MRKLFLLFALILTVCSTAMAQTQVLNEGSPVGTIGTLAGREAMVVDLGGTIGKVAIATKNVGAVGEVVSDYGTHFTPADANDADKNGLTDGWYVPSKKELDALTSHLTQYNAYHCVKWEVTETATLYLPCRFVSGGYKGDYVSSKRTNWGDYWTCYIYGFSFDNSGNFSYGADNRNESEYADCAIRPFHKLPTVEECRTIWYTSSNGEIVPPNKTNGFGGANIVSNVYDEERGMFRITFDGNVTSIGYQAFSGCSGLTSVTIPSSVTSIEYQAFSGCSGLTSLTIPSSVTSIGNSAFSDCSGLTSITIQSHEATIGNTAFIGCYVYSFNASESLEAEKNNYWGAYICDSQGLVTKDNVVISCSKKATSVIIPSGVTSIGNSAFNGCSGLTSIAIPNSVASIGNSAFNGCSGLTSITIPNSVTSIGVAAFLGCYGLTSLTIPNSVTSIGGAAFRNCSGLTSITLSDGITIIDDLTFTECTSLTSITIPSGVTTIGSYVFDGCTGLTSVTIPEGVVSIGGEYGYGVFRNCSSLTSITLPSSLEKMIYGFHFKGCSNLIYAEFLGETAPVWDTSRPECYPFIESGIEVSGTVLLVPNDDAVDKYTAAGYTNVYSILLPISEFKSIFSNEIETAMKGLTLTQSDADIVTACLTNINNATDLKTVLQERVKAQFVIILQKAKDEAIAGIVSALNSYAAIATQEDIDVLNKCKLNILEATNIVQVKKEISTILPIHRKLAKGYLRLCFVDYISQCITESDLKPYFDRIDSATNMADIDKIVKEAQKELNEKVKDIPYFVLGDKKYFVTKKANYEFHHMAEYRGGNIYFQDGVRYESNSINLIIQGEIEYTRSLPEGVWQCWYEPFEVKVDTEKFDAAEVADVSINAKEEVEVWFKRMENGAAMKPNTIYVIRAKEGQGNLTITSDPIIYTSKENQLTLQSAYENFTLTGNYSPVEHGDWYTLDKNGMFRQMASGSLKPQRFYLTITPRTDGHYAVDHYNTRQFINIMVMGDDEDGTTGITSCENENEDKNIYDLKGQKVTNIRKGQIYIMNGKKYIGK